MKTAKLIFLILVAFCALPVIHGEKNCQEYLRRRRNGGVLKVPIWPNRSNIIVTVTATIIATSTPTGELSLEHKDVRDKEAVYIIEFPVAKKPRQIILTSIRRNGHLLCRTREPRISSFGKPDMLKIITEEIYSNLMLKEISSKRTKRDDKSQSSDTSTDDDDNDDDHYGDDDHEYDDDDSYEDYEYYDDDALLLQDAHEHFSNVGLLDPHALPVNENDYFYGYHDIDYIQIWMRWAGMIKPAKDEYDKIFPRDRDYYSDDDDYYYSDDDEDDYENVTKKNTAVK